MIASVSRPLYDYDFILLFVRGNGGHPVWLARCNGIIATVALDTDQHRLSGVLCPVALAKKRVFCVDIDRSRTVIRPNEVDRTTKIGQMAFLRRAVCAPAEVLASAGLWGDLVA